MLRLKHLNQQKRLLNVDIVAYRAISAIFLSLFPHKYDLSFALNETSLCTSFSAAFEVVVVAKLLSSLLSSSIWWKNDAVFGNKESIVIIKSSKSIVVVIIVTFAHKWGFDCVGSFHRLRRRRRAFGRLSTPTKAFMVDNTNEIANVADAVLSKSLFDVTSGLDAFVSGALGGGGGK